MSGKILAVPELIAAVLQHLDPTSLVAAAQVNRIWAEEATNFIWRGSYRELKNGEAFLSALRQLAECSKERRDWYTRKIRHLYLGSSDVLEPPITLFLKQEGFKFPNIRSLVLDVTSENSHEDVVAQFLQPNLVCMENFGGYYSRWFFEQIQTKSPLLRLFLMDNRLFSNGHDPSSLNASDFLQFLLAMPSIQFLETCYGLEPLLNVQVMRHIFTRPGLQRLALGLNTIWDMRLMKEINLDNEIFPDLRSLEVTADERPLTLILPRLQQLQAVNLSLTRRDSSRVSLDIILGSLSKCYKLREISIDCDHWPGPSEVIVSGPALLSLANNCQLIRLLEVTAPLTASLDDKLIEEITSRLHDLEVFAFETAQFDDVSYCSLISFARHCPRLLELYLPVRVEITQLEKEPDDVKFPKLQELCVSQVTSLPMETPKDSSTALEILIRLMDSRLPNLVEFKEIHGSGQYADHVRKSIRNYLGERQNHDYRRSSVTLEIALDILGR